MTSKLPDGLPARGDDALSAWLGRRVALRSQHAEVPRRFENPVVDFEHDTERDWEPFEGALGAFHDPPGPELSPRRACACSQR